MRLNGTSVFSTILLKENQTVPKEVQVLRTGKFNHPKYGAFEITTKTLADMKANFDANVRGIEMAFDYFHDSDKEASGWVKELQLREGNTELWATVDWTPKAEKKLAEREIRYFSPDFSFSWTDPEKGTTFNNVLFGGGLTNRPFVKEMKAIVAGESMSQEIELGGPGSGRRPGGGKGGEPKTAQRAKHQEQAKPGAYHAELGRLRQREKAARETGASKRTGPLSTPQEEAELAKKYKLNAEDQEIELGGPGSGRRPGGGSGGKYSPEARMARRQAALTQSAIKERAFEKKSNAIKSGLKARAERVAADKWAAGTHAAKQAARKSLSEKYLKLKETKGDTMTDLEKALARIKELEADNIKLADGYADLEKKMADMPAPMEDEGSEIEALKQAIAELQAQLDQALADKEILAAEKKKADEAKMLAEKEQAFAVLLTEGKACAAQKDAFIKGDMNEFIKLAEKPNLTPRGSSESGSLANDEITAILKLAEEKQKVNPKLTRGDAISMAKKELKK